MTTIARVAQEAGVGVGTVSRVINGSTAVSEATRRRVLEVVAELGYEPNATARALSTGRTRAIGVIAPFFTRPSVIERLRGVAPVLAASGYQLILFDVETPRAARRRVPLADRPRRRPALDLARPLPRRTWPGCARPACRVVLVDHAHDRLPSVIVDDVEGGRLATAHLLELGHTPDRVRRRHARRGPRRLGELAALRRLPARAGRRRGPPRRPELVRLRPHGEDAGDGRRATCSRSPTRRPRSSPPPTSRRSP